MVKYYYSTWLIWSGHSRASTAVASNIIFGLDRGDDDDNKNINSTFHIFNKFHHFSEPAHLIKYRQYTADARRRLSHLSENSVTISPSTLHIISHVCRMIRRLLVVQVDVELTTSRFNMCRGASHTIKIENENEARGKRVQRMWTVLYGEVLERRSWRRRVCLYTMYEIQSIHGIRPAVL